MTYTTPPKPYADIIGLLKGIVVISAFGLVVYLVSTPFRKPEVHHTPAEIARCVEATWKMNWVRVYAMGTDDEITFRIASHMVKQSFFKGLMGLSIVCALTFPGMDSRQPPTVRTVRIGHGNQEYKEVRVYLERRTPRR